MGYFFVLFKRHVWWCTFYCVWKWKCSKGNICTAACGWGDYKYLEFSVSECKCSTLKSSRDLLQIYPFSNRYLSTWNSWRCTINYQKRLSAFSKNTVLASCHFWEKNILYILCVWHGINQLPLWHRHLFSEELSVWTESHHKDGWTFLISRLHWQRRDTLTRLETVDGSFAYYWPLN